MMQPTLLLEAWNQQRFRQRPQFALTLFAWLNVSCTDESTVTRTVPCKLKSPS